MPTDTEQALQRDAHTHTLASVGTVVEKASDLDQLETVIEGLASEQAHKGWVSLGGNKGRRGRESRRSEEYKSLKGSRQCYV